MKSNFLISVPSKFLEYLINDFSTVIAPCSSVAQNSPPQSCNIKHRSEIVGISIRDALAVMIPILPGFTKTIESILMNFVREAFPGIPIFEAFISISLYRISIMFNIVDSETTNKVN